MPSQTFAQFYNLGKHQYELDFVDVPINNGDLPLFIDPYAISKRNDRWSVDCHNKIVSFFQRALDCIRKGEQDKVHYMFSQLKEPNETRFGLSHERPRGRGIGDEQADDLSHALTESTAVRTGLIVDLEDCELLIDGIGRDKISDLTTNIIKANLISYTADQCELFNIPTHDLPVGFVWNFETNQWDSVSAPLPVCNDRKVILVPKAIARFDSEFSYTEYHQHFVLNFLQAESLNAGDSLVRTLKNGEKRPPTKKSLKENHPATKSYLYTFTKEHPEVLQKYKRSKAEKLKDITNEELAVLAEQEQKYDFDGAKAKLDAIPTGDTSADDYHSHMIGVMTAIFYPHLIHPHKEHRIHNGRKRIDIVHENAAKDGFFLTLPQNKNVPSAYIFSECKNYSEDPANHELDQLSGRFSINRGKFGFLLCRKIENKDLFFQRCKDTAQDDRGFIIPLDDEDIKLLLDLKKQKKEREINSFLGECFKKLVS